jgi:hypothetical protein
VSDMGDSLQNFIGCAACREREAAIFHIDGDFCLECWQKRTEPLTAA